MALALPKTIQERFEEFHAANPHIYTLLVAKARQAVQRQYNHLSIALLVEIIRWDDSVTTTTQRNTPNGKYFKFSNDYRSRYARMIMEQEPDLAGFFKVKELTSA